MKPKRIVLHATATAKFVSIQAILNFWRSIGWDYNGYHWLVDYYGIAVRLQGDNYIANGVKGFNSDSIHIAYIGGLVGNKASDTRSVEQKETLQMLVFDYLKLYGKIDVVGHRDLSPDLNKNGIIEPYEWLKVCPCFDVQKEFSNIVS